MKRDLPFAAITMGDAAGIGPEVIVKALSTYHPQWVRPVVIGSYDVFSRAAAIVQAGVTLNRIAAASAGDYRPGVVNVLDAGGCACSSVDFGKVSSVAWSASG